MSWKTTIFGSVVLVGLFAFFITALVTGHDVSATDIVGAIVAAAGGLGLLVARDDDKSSEDVGIK